MIGSRDCKVYIGQGMVVNCEVAIVYKMVDTAIKSVNKMT